MPIIPSTCASVISTGRRKSALGSRVANDGLLQIEVIGDPLETARVRRVITGGVKQFKTKMRERIVRKMDLKPVNDDVCQICYLKEDPVDLDEDNVNWVQCSQCSRWFHRSCADYHQSDVDFTCLDCETIEQST
ncbi:hypothetical protein P879_10330 [Paragonimus westermani]|uniref:Zinc finger PHD-type domain-containing protein n=1 Tax=Paragonimus westermani TaxID=34504 RepID=A0A8T0DAA0_9TREM|nr:hypothetical protein P879_10330 [Paragonimus westermani]